MGLCCVDHVVEHNREILRIGERKAKAVLAQIHHLNHLSCDMIALQAAGGVIREMKDDITAAGFDLLKETVGIRDQKNFQHKIIPFYYGTVYVNRVSTAIEYIYQRGVLEVVDITVLTRRDCLIGSKPAVDLHRPRFAMHHLAGKDFVSVNQRDAKHGDSGNQPEIDLTEERRCKRGAA